MSAPAAEAPVAAAHVTVEDVARAAGVSRQTVSRVLNDHPSVASTTRRRVRAAMVELRWSPDPAARALGRRSVLRPVERGVAPSGDRAAIAELAAAGFRVVEIPAGSSAESVAGLLALDGAPGVVVVLV